MPAVKIKPRSNQNKSSTQDTSSQPLVVVIVDGEDIEVYTGKEAEDKLAE